MPFKFWDVLGSSPTRLRKSSEIQRKKFRTGITIFPPYSKRFKAFFNSIKKNDFLKIILKRHRTKYILSYIRISFALSYAYSQLLENWMFLNSVYNDENSSLDLIIRRRDGISTNRDDSTQLIFVCNRGNVTYPETQHDRVRSWAA